MEAKRNCREVNNRRNWDSLSLFLDGSLGTLLNLRYLFIWQIHGFEIGAMLDMVVGDFCVKTADRSAHAKECTRLYSELAVEMIQLAFFRDQAMEFSIERDELQRRAFGLAGTMDKMAGVTLDLIDENAELLCELSRLKSDQGNRHH